MNNELLLMNTIIMIAGLVAAIIIVPYVFGYIHGCIHGKIVIYTDILRDDEIETLSVIYSLCDNIDFIKTKYENINGYDNWLDDVKDTFNTIDNLILNIRSDDSSINTLNCVKYTIKMVDDIYKETLFLLLLTTKISFLIKHGNFKDKEKLDILMKELERVW